MCKHVEGLRADLWLSLDAVWLQPCALPSSGGGGHVKNFVGQPMNKTTERAPRLDLIGHCLEFTLSAVSA
jgi:hypothetical protein